MDNKRAHIGNPGIYRHLYEVFSRECSFQDQDVHIYGKPTCRLPKTNYHCRTHKLFSQMSKAFIPSVYAAENDNQGEITITEKVTSSRPKIHISEDEIERYLAGETGRDRLREMFSKHHTREISPELTLIVSVAERCGFIAFVLASFFGSIEAKERFVKENKHTKFSTKLRANRMMYDTILMGGLKNGALWAIKTAAFAGIFVGSAQCISVYRNKTSPWDYVTGAAITGAVFKTNLGLRGMIAGSIIAGGLGGVAGILVYFIMRRGNETQEQRRYLTIHDRLQQKKEMQLLQDAAATGLEVQTQTIADVLP